MADPQGAAQPLGRRREQVRPVVGEQRDHRAVRHHDALGAPGRARREDDVGGVVGGERAGPVGVGQVGAGPGGDRRGCLVVVDDDDRRAGGRPLADPRRRARPGDDGRDTGRQGRRRDHRGRPRVGHDRGEALVGEVGVERQVGRAGLLHRQQRLDHPVGAGQHERDHVLGPAAGGDEVAGQAVGPGVEVAVGAAHVLEHEGDRVGRGRGPGLEQRRDGGRGDGTGRADRGRHEGGALGRGQHVEPGDRACGIVDHRRQHPVQATGQRVDLGAVEQVGPVLQRQAQAVAGHRHHGERVVGGVAGGPADEHQSGAVGGVAARFVRGLVPGVGAGRRGGRRAARRGCDRVVLDDHQRVEQVAAPGAGQALQLGQAEVLVVEQARALGPQPVEQVPHRLVGPEPHPHRQRVDEHADHPLDVGYLGGAARDGRAEHHVVPPGRRGQHDGPGRLDHAAQGQAPRPRRRRQARGQRGGQVRAAGLGQQGGPVGIGGRDERRLGHPVERGGPGGPGLVVVAPGQPGQVAGERRRARAARPRRRRRRAPPARPPAGASTSRRRRCGGR